ncbi:MAG: Mur ligase domain-containing protein, partial [Bacteroidales bacterium]|nr:Mur ligase domain-containing protein [Bacteroidales bacterium]
MSYTVKQIQEWTQAKVLGDKQVEVDTLILDSRKLLIPDRCMFVCIQGSRHDGHHYIADLYKKGVRIFMVSELTDVINDIPGATLIVVNNTLTALQTLATRHRKNFQIPVVGITGSNGKTVVKEWLASALSIQLNTVRNPKSYNSQVGVPLSVWLINEQSEMGIFEAGISQKNEMKLLQKIIKPTHGIFTNIGMAHQENFSDLKEKIDEKL